MARAVAVRNFPWKFSCLGDTHGVKTSAPRQLSFIKLALILIIFWIPSTSSAADCSAPSIYLDSQTAVNGFQANFGNGGTCNTITANLTITGTDITNLNGLTAITGIGGSLTIQQTSLINLQGLSNLDYVGDLSIEFNALLANINGLAGLTSIGGVLSFRANPLVSSINPLATAIVDVSGVDLSSLQSLSSISLLSSLQSLDGSLHMSVLPLLTNLDALSNLTSIGGNLTISYNDTLADVDGLSDLETVGERVSLGENSVLADLDGFSSLNTIGDGLSLSAMNQLTNLDGLANLASIGGDLRIVDMASLVNLDGLSSLAELGGQIYIWNNDSLVDLDGVSSVKSISHDLSIQENGALANVDGLSGLSHFGGDILVLNNASLHTISGLSGLKGNVVGNLMISGNPLLVNVDALVGVTDVGDDLIINGNSLTNLNGLSNLLSVSGMVVISNTSAQNLQGLSNLTFIGEGLGIVLNSALLDLNGLSGFTGVLDGGLEVSDNPSLTSMNGVAGITAVDDRLYIKNNPKLKEIPYLALTSVGHSVEISNNQALTNVHGLIQLIEVGFDVRVENNPKLTNCIGLIPLLDSIDDGWPGPGPGDAGVPDVYRRVFLNGNGTGCTAIPGILDSEAVSLFNVSKSFSDSRPKTVGIDLSCATSTTRISVIDGQASPAKPAEFQIRRYIPNFGQACTAQEITGTSGYTTDNSDCENVILTAADTHECDILNQQNPAGLTISALFIDPPTCAVPEVSLSVNCPSAQVLPTASLRTIEGEVTAQLTDFHWMGETCSVVDSVPLGYLKSDSEGCDVIAVVPGGATTFHCTVSYVSNPEVVFFNGFEISNCVD